jgi:hypothetical protein
MVFSQGANICRIQGRVGNFGNLSSLPAINSLAGCSKPKPSLWILVAAQEISIEFVGTAQHLFIFVGAAQSGNQVLGG